VPNFSAGGIATPADAAMMMKLGAETVFVGSGIFKAGANLSDTERLEAQAKRATAIVNAVLYYREPKKLAEISKGLGEAMVGINCSELFANQRMADRGW
jgi:pyridoxal 5'-phosphate synthase pdxS subunit